MMTQELIDQKKKVLQYSQEQHGLVSDLCTPLKTFFGIDFFAHGNFILNDFGYCERHTLVSTNLNFLKSYLFSFDDNGRIFTKVIREIPPDSYSYFLWGDEECPLIQVKRYHGSTRGLTIYKKNKNAIEFWEFSGIHQGEIPSVVTQTAMAPFLDFITYFNKYKILNQLISPLTNFSSLVDMSYIHPNKDQIENFKNAINANSLTLDLENQLITLSKREWECLSEIARGKTCKEIACDFSISPRTVEKHLDNIKDKTGVHYKSELVKLFYQHNSPYFF